MLSFDGTKLATKKYIFGNNKTDTSQFKGIEKNGPFVDDEKSEKAKIKSKLSLPNDNNISVENLKAKDFLENYISVGFYKK